MTNKIRIDGEKLVKLVKETPKEELEKQFAKAIHENMYELCMEALEKRDRHLNLTGKCKKCYDYLAEQLILNHINGKSMFDVIDDIRNGKFYNTWKGFLCGVYYIVEDGGEFHGSIGRGIEDIVNNSGISRKAWIKFLDCYFA